MNFVVAEQKNPTASALFEALFQPFAPCLLLPLPYAYDFLSTAAELQLRLVKSQKPRVVSHKTEAMAGAVVAPLVKQETPNSPQTLVVFVVIGLGPRYFGSFANLRSLAARF